ncbi:MAG: Uma2 family endonuclease [Candidatus Electrothrix sp. LOE2]|nr:Uma2 family endonuclease [Candidatus Electrothrix sp. LOE2]
MEWANVINNPLLRDLPFKIELNKWGKILMSPASNNHGRLQYEVGRRIDRHKGTGKVIMECSIQTGDGVKVADVAWASDAFIAEFGYSTPYMKAPEICVEITSSSNTKDEIEEKVQLYLAKGANEVWVVNEDRDTTYYTHEGKLSDSREI